MSLKREPRRYPRWLLSCVYFAEGFCARILRGKFWYGRTLGRDRLRVRRLDVPVTDLPEALDGFRIAHLSDFHAGPFLDAASLEGVIEVTNRESPDIVCYTGDYITHRVEEGLALAPVFERIESRLGAFSVFGNHDYRERREGEMVEAFARVGVTSLRNGGRAVEVGGARLFVAGIEDLEEGKVIDLVAALADSRPDDFVILLAHHPDVALGLRSHDEVSLVLSGHTHGGQIQLLGSSIFGGSLRSRFGTGLSDAALGARVHVTNGVGVLILPWRIGAPPELALLTLKRV